MIKNKEGKKFGKIKDVIHNNRFVGEFEIPGGMKMGVRVHGDVCLGLPVVQHVCAVAAAGLSRTGGDPAGTVVVMVHHEADLHAAHGVEDLLEDGAEHVEEAV